MMMMIIHLLQSVTSNKVLCCFAVESCEVFVFFTEGSCVLLWLRIFQTSPRQNIKKRLLPEGNSFFKCNVSLHSIHTAVCKMYLVGDISHITTNHSFSLWDHAKEIIKLQEWPWAILRLCLDILFVVIFQLCVPKKLKSSAIIHGLFENYSLFSATQTIDYFWFWGQRANSNLCFSWKNKL